MKAINLKLFFFFALFVFSFASISSSYADTVVIVHKDNASAINPALIKRIFLGKAKNFKGGGVATPIELPESNPTRSAFNKGLLKKSDTQMKAYWARLVFTGKATPPVQVADDAAVIEKVSNNPTLIGYIDSASVTDAVKVVHSF